MQKEGFKFATLIIIFITYLVILVDYTIHQPIIK